MGVRDAGALIQQPPSAAVRGVGKGAQSRRGAERLAVWSAVVARRTVCVAPACASESSSLRLCGSAALREVFSDAASRRSAR